MLLKVVVRSVLLSRSAHHIAQSARHCRITRVSTNFRNIPPPTSPQLRCLSSDDFDDEDNEEDYSNIAQLGIKYLLHDDQMDDWIREIDKYEKIDEVKNCIETKLDQLEKKHIIRLLLLSGKMRNKDEPTKISNINDLIQKIDILLPDVGNDETELAAILLHLRLLGVQRTNDTMQKIIEKILEIFKEKGSDSDLFALSMFSEMMVLTKDLYSRLVIIDTLPIAKQRFERVDNARDYNHLISYLNNVHGIFSIRAMLEIRGKIEECIDKNLINNNNVLLFKTLNFLNYPYFAAQNGALVQRLLLLLQDRVYTMNSYELLRVNKSLFTQHEPASLVTHLKNRAHVVLNETKDVKLLQIVCKYSSPQERTSYVEMFKDKILNFQTTLGPSTDSLSDFFKILRLLRVSDEELCDCFWTKMVNKIFSLPLQDLKHRLPKYFHRYMYFNNNLGGTYRHIEFEKIVYEYCIEELRTSSAHFPKDYVKFAAFVIAYADKYESIPPFVIEKLLMIQDQLGIEECKYLGRALEILYWFRVRQSNVTLNNQVEILQFIMDNCTQRHIQDPKITINDASAILRSFVRRRALRDSQLFYEIMNWFNDRKLNLTSRIIRDLCSSMQVTKFAHDSICDQMFEYVANNKDMVSGETVEKILTACFQISYFPENLGDLDHCSEIINRDFDVMNGFSIVQALLALTFYKAAPFELVTKVFNGDFIRRLEQEVEMSYRKDKQSRNVMQKVMELNRSICLDHPEYNIKWFQQNFIEAQMSKKPALRSMFHSEVHNLLLNIVPNQQYLAINKNTPYGYRIDFELHVDKDYNKFLKIDPRDYIGVNFKPNVTKIAVLLLGHDTFCINDVNRLRGVELLRMRHLEMMNYKVIHVKKNDFRIMYENVSAKIKHLKKLLQISG